MSRAEAVRDAERAVVAGQLLTPGQAEVLRQENDALTARAAEEWRREHGPAHFEVSTAAGVSRPAFSPSGQLWEWTPTGTTVYGELADAVQAADAIPAQDAVLVQVCRYPVPDRFTAPCVAQRVGTHPWTLPDGRHVETLAGADL